MDIGTATPSAAERQSVPHHLLDVIDPDHSYSTGRWRTDAIQRIVDILDRKKLPLLVGGTMLYYRMLVAGLDTLPQADPDIRRQIDADAARRGWPALHADLAKVDPKTAHRLPPTDSQRIQRALEVWRLTGKPLSQLQGASKTDLPFKLKSFALIPSDRDALHKKIALRFDAMLKAGLIDELKHLKTRYNLAAGMPSMRCVGYRQVWDHLEGKLDNAEMRHHAIIATRQLAKRQLTWLRSFPDLVRLDAGGAEEAALAFERLLRELR
jgi:tRNA dimethylallyltransferase